MVGKSQSTPSFGWTKIPLIAFAVFSIGPALIYVILYVLYVTFGAEPRGYVNRLDGSLVAASFLCTIASWPFLALFAVCNVKAKKEGSDSHSLKVALWTSLLAMSAPNVLLLVMSPKLISEMNAPGAGLAMGILFLGMMIVVPVLGLMGWFASRITSWFVCDALVYSRAHSRPRKE